MKRIPVHGGCFKCKRIAFDPAGGMRSGTVDGDHATNAVTRALCVEGPLRHISLRDSSSARAAGQQAHCTPVQSGCLRRYRSEFRQHICHAETTTSQTTCFLTASRRLTHFTRVWQSRAAGTGEASDESSAFHDCRTICFTRKTNAWTPASCCERRPATQR